MQIPVRNTRIIVSILTFSIIEMIINYFIFMVIKIHSENINFRDMLDENSDQ